MNYNKIKELIEYGIKNIKKEHYKITIKPIGLAHQRQYREATRHSRYGYFYNAFDKNKLKAKIENLNNRLHKKPKKYKD